MQVVIEPTELVDGVAVEEVAMYRVVVRVVDDGGG